MDTDTEQARSIAQQLPIIPLEPIRDERSYQSAIQLLDTLFARDDYCGPVEMEYFKALANLAYDYECTHLGFWN